MNIYVGNLNFKCSEEELTNLFAQYGNVGEVKIINDRETGKSKGYGFVEMKDELDRNQAITALDQTEFLGRKINVRLANEKAPRKEKKSQKHWKGGNNTGKKRASKHN